MELHSPVAAKKIWNLLRVAFFMMRKGIISKRKLIMNMNLLMKRGKIKFMNKNLSTLLAFHHHHHPRRSYGEFSIQEYEFSCSNSPNPAFFHANNKRRNYFPCLNVVVEGDETPGAAGPAICDVPRIEYTPSPSPSPQCMYLAAGEAKSPFSVRISNFSEEEEEDDAVCREVDDEAEEFIRQFYEQLRVQSRIALIQYEEKEVQEMLARGH